MAENTQIISGYIVRPNGDPFTEGVVRFTLGRSDTDEDEVIAAGKYVEFDIASDGSFAAELWPNTRGNVGGAYIVQVREAERTPFETVGRVQVQDDGPYDLAALLRADIPQAQNTFYSVLSQDEYDAFVAEMDAKVAEAKGYAESYDVAAISAAVTATGNDASATAADRVATGEDRVATGQDASATAADRVATGEDRVATGQDVIAAGNSADEAETQAGIATAAAASINVKAFDVYADAQAYSEDNPAALVFSGAPMEALLIGGERFWQIAPFAPGFLFSSTSKGVWYDPSDLSTLWQDTAGTVPVTAAGQSVARMDDKSGLGNHALQAVTSARPTLQTDGSLYWLEFDGVDDFLEVPLAATQGLQKFTALIGLSFGNPSAIEIAFGAYQSSSRFAYGAFSGSGLAKAQVTSQSAASTALGVAATSDVPLVMNVRYDGSTGSLDLRSDGSDVAENANSGGGGTPDTTQFHIGARNTAGVASAFSESRFYGVVTVDRPLSASEVSDSEQYLADKTGVTL